ncbi:Rieske 2Fe-2S domain-containing protein [Scytonema sp. UIC 10036]|uniref:Rieske 2Fe-2S domain-containing protein n=1 Tax=Scytonema sp. UIC 10036 TaxID=2304196 RepID=UPI0012DA4F5B|nr:Rieske 2Fe-2S domain-containing protein [Scytonema sp. UIC 10036]MUG99153.1 Rieske 2Fe-2S domain-containing protein [Scytonema sp. UIC 10036]
MMKTIKLPLSATKAPIKELNLTAKSIGVENTEFIPLDKIAERVMCGEVIVVSKCLQTIGYFERIKEASLEAIRQAVGEEKATQIRDKGFEALHRVIDLDEIPSVSNCSYEIIRALAPALARDLVKKVFQKQTPFYFEESPNVRFHIPFDVVEKRRKLFSNQYWNGKVTAHGPHHDSWYQCPINCVNVWIAIGSVKIGNGLSVYPQVYGKRLPCTEDGKIVQNQYFGSTLNFELEPGDALIFHGEHLHSSEINSTDLSRYVISLRMTLEKPKFLDKSPYENNYIYSECHDGFKGKLSQLLVKISRFFKKQINSVFGKNKNYILSAFDALVFDDTSSNFPQPVSVKSVESACQDETRLVFDSEELPVGTIRPISQKMCVARLDKDQVVAFSRYCPHEGADLAGGYLRDGCIVCPWHNLPFNADSGVSPCQSLSKLTILKCIEDSDKVEVQM